MKRTGFRTVAATVALFIFAAGFPALGGPSSYDLSVLLDEPHSALDESAVALVAHLVSAVAERGGCAVVASHDRRQVDKLTGRQVQLESGSLL